MNNMETLRWDEIPVKSQCAGALELRVKNHAVVHHNNSLFLLGGCNSGKMDVLVFNISDKTWKKPCRAIGENHNDNELMRDDEDASHNDPGENHILKVTGTAPSFRNGHTATLVTTRGRTCIFVIGGWLGNDASNELHVLDITDPDSSLHWSTPTALKGIVPGPCNMHSADFIPNKREIYVFRGGDGSEYLNDLHALNVDTLTWRKVPNRGVRPQARADHASAFVKETNQIFIFGGWNGRSRLNDIHVFNTETSEWSEPKIGGMIPQPRAGMTLTVVGRRLFLFGGNGINTTVCNDLHVLDCSTMSFVDLEKDEDIECCPSNDQPNPNCAESTTKIAVYGTGPRHRAGHSATAVGRFIYIIGGSCGPRYHDDCHILDTDSLESPPSEEMETSHHVVSQLSTLCDNKELSDVTFLVEGKEISAHKLVLVLASKFYRAMFTSEFREKEDATTITVPNCTYEAFLTIMQHVYGVEIDLTVSSPSSFENTVNILEMADQLLLDNLKEECERALQSTVNSDTINYLLDIACQTNASFLQYCCHHYKRNHGLGMCSKDIYL
mmetsp:Transcript_16882/g.24790  ORF Transcript_16882/g.24790 Transcript_16882/m.24790 type:complete len:555 (+) Transcript_16882:83-1747(+)